MKYNKNNKKRSGKNKKNNLDFKFIPKSFLEDINKCKNIAQEKIFTNYNHQISNWIIELDDVHLDNNINEKINGKFYLCKNKFNDDRIIFKLKLRKNFMNSISFKHRYGKNKIFDLNN